MGTHCFHILWYINIKRYLLSLFREKGKKPTEVALHWNVMTSSSKLISVNTLFTSMPRVRCNI